MPDGTIANVDYLDFQQLSALREYKADNAYRLKAIYNRFAIRGPLVAVLARDYRGAATDISPSVFNPLTPDGKLRRDLFAQRKIG
ncbi:hypothetical protein ADUPG1_002195, partial [Aduncisulcus paluster]